MTSDRATTRALWIGTYQPEGASPGSGEGVWRVDVDLRTGAFGEPRLAVTLPAPSFLALHPSGRTLYAVGEDDPGTLTALEVLADAAPDAGAGDPATGLAVLGAVASGGSFPCHVLALDDEVWVANYGDGVAARLPVDPATGVPAAEGVTTFGHEGSGPVTDRQEGPHAHFVLPARAGGDADGVLVSDLGTDELRRLPTGKAATAATSATGGGPDARPDGPLPTVPLPAGTGPRHAVRCAGHLVVVGELDGRAHVLAPRADGGYEHLGSAPVMDLEATLPQGTPVQPSHVSVSRTAPDEALYVGVRGPDVLAVLTVTPAGVEAGPGSVLDGRRWAHRADVPLGEGAWPRHHAVLDRGAAREAAGAPGALAPHEDLVVVALQGTSELVSLRVDPRTGAGEVVHRLPMPTPPACVLEAW
ncbi:lactonase family protein [Puerhibacterium puerhi]|uniref:lactonase family protein n=1 Tax=Puerhibacterium puerhi TaxID=2692623 RepID=UPI00135794FD|nr:beta-propeller fold lactonase family protein [Puerhibacterium puerhi]